MGDAIQIALCQSHGSIFSFENNEVSLFLTDKSTKLTDLIGVFGSRSNYR